MTGREPRGISASYQVFMLVLSLYAIGALAVQRSAALQPEVRVVLDYADLAVCLVFFADFGISLVNAPDRWRYFRTWGWLDLLSSIPTLDSARWGRGARVLRVLRVLRALRGAKLLAGLLLRRRAEGAFLAASLVTLLLIVLCSTSILHFEDDPASNIKTAQDAVWWAMTTITTVGYGDRYPVTAEGRFIGVLLMIAGVGLFGTFSGFLAAWLVGAETEQETSEISALREEVAALRRVIEARPQSPGSLPAPEP